MSQNQSWGNWFRSFVPGSRPRQTMAESMEATVSELRKLRVVQNKLEQQINSPMPVFEEIRDILTDYPDLINSRFGGGGIPVAPTTILVKTIMRYARYSPMPPITDEEKHLNYALIELLLSLGADVNVPGHFIIRPINYAAKFATPDVLQLLVEHGAIINENCYTPERRLWRGDIVPATVCDLPIVYAIKGGNVPNLQWLIEHGAKLKFRHNENTLLSYAIFDSDHESMLLYYEPLPVETKLQMIEILLRAGVRDLLSDFYFPRKRYVLAEFPIFIQALMLKTLRPRELHQVTDQNLYLGFLELLLEILTPEEIRQRGPAGESPYTVALQYLGWRESASPPEEERVRIQNIFNRLKHAMEGARNYFGRPIPNTNIYGTRPINVARRMQIGKTSRNSPPELNATLTSNELTGILQPTQGGRTRRRRHRRRNTRHK